ncbi:MAG: hypothetical protein LQ352_004618 [Teloschistes flavicans]|nr:MAG: hypothetical protein LQ352_004618 [Teloschistes flavicans]
MVMAARDANGNVPTGHSILWGSSSAVKRPRPEETRADPPPAPPAAPPKSCWNPSAMAMAGALDEHGNPPSSPSILPGPNHAAKRPRVEGSLTPPAARSKLRWQPSAMVMAGARDKNDDLVSGPSILWGPDRDVRGIALDEFFPPPAPTAAHPRVYGDPPSGPSISWGPNYGVKGVGSDTCPAALAAKQTESQQFARSRAPSPSPSPSPSFIDHQEPVLRLRGGRAEAPTLKALTAEVDALRQEFGHERRVPVQEASVILGTQIDDLIEHYGAEIFDTIPAFEKLRVALQNYQDNLQLSDGGTQWVSVEDLSEMTAELDSREEKAWAEWKAWLVRARREERRLARLEREEREAM